MFFGAMKPNVIFFPENEPRSVYVTMETPLGSSIETTDEITLDGADDVRDEGALLEQAAFGERSHRVV